MDPRDIQFYLRRLDQARSELKILLKELMGISDALNSSIENSNGYQELPSTPSRLPLPPHFPPN